MNFRYGKYDVLYGVDENLLPDLAIGSRGAIGRTCNFLAPMYLKVRSHFDNGRTRDAQVIMFWLVRVVGSMEQFPAVPAQKAVMKMLGFDLGSCRLPLTQLPDEDYAQLKKDLEEINFFDYLSGKRTPG